MEPWQLWQLWQDMARESEQSARLAEDGGCPRSAASRYYYAAYQAATALLLYRGLTPPTGREAWGHEETPLLVQSQLQALIRSRDSRNDLSGRLSRLYKLRLIADYRGTLGVPTNRIAEAGRNTRFILRVMGETLPKE